MTGIYLHIPFCRQACHYCDFHFSTNLKLIPELIKSIGIELENKALQNEDEISTIYFGGGTPSILDSQLIGMLMDTIGQHYQVPPGIEITLEANPEDLTREKLQQIKGLGVNRLSIGSQTFHPEVLQWMNRAHDVSQLMEAYSHARGLGFDNISLDLMYAIPGVDLEKDLIALADLNPEHVSVYGLTIEDKTVFGHRNKKGNLPVVDEEVAADNYLESIAWLATHGYQHYEVSNFAKEGFESKHNSNYWMGKPYIGVGPGAHSFDGENRRTMNVSNNARYIRAIANHEPFAEEEILSATQRHNEKILTGLRTCYGVDLSLVGMEKNSKNNAFIAEIMSNGWAVIDGEKLKLTPEGFLHTDTLALELMIDE